MPDKPTLAPNEISIPPVRMTIISPTATIAKIVESSVMSYKLSGVKKTGLLSEIANTISNKNRKMPPSRNAATRSTRFVFAC